MRNIFLISICAALGGGIFAQSMNMFQQGTSAPAQAAPAPVQAAPASGGERLSASRRSPAKTS